MRKAVYLDRDGTIIEDAHYINNPNDVVLIEGAAAALKNLQQAGYLLFVLSNQSGVGRGIITDSQFRAVHEKFVKLLEDNGVQIDEYGFCFHRPEDDCACRKPGTALVRREYNGAAVDLENSFFVGDRDTDLMAGERIGATPVLVLTGKGVATQSQIQDTPLLAKSWVVEGLSDFAGRLLRS